MSLNPYILVPGATWLIAQLIKFSIRAFKGDLNPRMLYASGGMPSAHSAVVSSLATTSLLLDGSGSHIFGLTLVLALIVMYDSFGVRLSSGEQGVALNKLFDSLAEQKLGPIPRPKLRETLGHKPSEVLVGAGLGIVLGGIFNYEKLTGFTDFVTTVPSKTENLIYAILAVLLLVGGVAFRFGLRRLRPKSTVLKAAGKKVLVRSQSIGWLALILAGAEYERASYISWRLWNLLALILGVGWIVLLIISISRIIPPQIAKELDIERKQRWFEPSGKKKRKKSRR